MALLQTVCSEVMGPPSPLEISPNLFSVPSNFCFSRQTIISLLVGHENIFDFINFLVLLSTSSVRLAAPAAHHGPHGPQRVDSAQQQVEDKKKFFGGIKIYSFQYRKIFRLSARRVWRAATATPGRARR